MRCQEKIGGKIKAACPPGKVPTTLCKCRHNTEPWRNRNEHTHERFARIRRRLDARPPPPRTATKRASRRAVAWVCGGTIPAHTINCLGMTVSSLTLQQLCCPHAGRSRRACSCTVAHCRARASHRDDRKVTSPTSKPCRATQRSQRVSLRADLGERNTQGPQTSKRAT